jgi:hypothetical protein
MFSVTINIRHESTSDAYLIPVFVSPLQCSIFVYKRKIKNWSQIRQLSPLCRKNSVSKVLILLFDLYTVLL